MRQMVWNVIKTTPWKYASGDYLWLFFTTVINQTQWSHRIWQWPILSMRCAFREIMVVLFMNWKQLKYDVWIQLHVPWFSSGSFQRRNRPLWLLKGQSLFEWRCVEFNLKGFDSWIIAGLHVLFNCKQIVLLSVPQHLNKYGNYNSYEINKSLKLTPSFDAILSAHISAKSLPSTPK